MLSNKISLVFSIAFLMLLSTFTCIGQSAEKSFSKVPAVGAKKDQTSKKKKKRQKQPSKKQPAKKQPSKKLAYPASSYDVTPEQNSGVLNGPLLNRKVPRKKDPKVTLQMAIEDLIKTYGSKYPKGKEFLERLKKISSANDPEFQALKREALLANPLIDFNKILLVKRKGLAMPNNWQGNTSIKQKTVDNELMSLDVKTGKLDTVYKPGKQVYVGQFDLDFNADKVLFSTRADDNSWCISEIKINPSTGAMVPGSYRQASPEMGSDIDNYDAVYLPSEKIIFCSSSGYTGVPCVGGKDYVANLHVMDKNGSNVRRLCFEQDNNWNPVMMENGRVMYLRWEYTDSAHYFSRIIMYISVLKNK